MNWTLFVVVGLCYAISAKANLEKTKKALRTAWRSFMNVIPALAAMLLLVSIAVALVPERIIASLIGHESGFFGWFLGSVIGAVTLIPAFVAFPLAKVLMESGAGAPQMAVFVSTLMMVGVATAPLEASYFGWKATFLRNVTAYFYSFVVGYVVRMGVTLWA